MKYLKLYEDLTFGIDRMCSEYDIENYTINKDGTIDVDGDVEFGYLNIRHLPLQFNRVSGSFNCSGNKLISLNGSPKEVGELFYCENNRLTSLKGGPSKVGEDFDCDDNKLTTLEFGPNTVGGYYYCKSNKLVDVRGCPEHFNDFYYMDHNPVEEIIDIILIIGNADGPHDPHN